MTTVSWRASWPSRPWPSVALLAVALLAATLLALALKVYLWERSYLHPPRGKLALTLAEVRVPGLQAVTFAGPGGIALSGWFAPSRNGAAVVLTHGTGGDRCSLVPELRLLAAAGFGVLAFDWPGHGLSEGEVHWGKLERDALAAAITFLARQPTVDPERIGALGYSMGGYVAVEVAAEDPRLRALAVLGTPGDATALMRWEYRRGGLLAYWLALVADELLGYDPDDHKAVALAASLAPRPLLVIHGGRDDTVPLSMARELYTAAREPKQLLVIEEAGHGGYAALGGERYARALVDFFRPLAKTTSELGP